jgi:hypothetical protein
VCGSAVRSWPHCRALESQCVLTELIAQFIDSKFAPHVANCCATAPARSLSFSGRAIHASLRSPGDGEAGARARLASRTPSVATSMWQSPNAVYIAGPIRPRQPSLRLRRRAAKRRPPFWR